MKMGLAAFSTAFSIVALLGCTSRESKIREAAGLGAKTELQDELREQISERVSGKAHLQATAARVLTERAKFTVVKVQDDENTASAVVEARTEPDNVKESLIDIMAKLESQKEARFNVPDAIKLIRQKMNIPEGAYSEKVYRIKLENKGEWRALRTPKNTK